TVTASIMETSKDQGKRPRNPRMQRLTWRNLSDDRAAAPCRESGLVPWCILPEAETAILAHSGL
ncbi:MAG TPA: hypothetical protein VIU82_04965, partial [Bosea sp. (in: a-proteobacteria)]